ncbi:hypothetical protein [Geoglobus acetivorans]|uniref:Uncharacterized protein n=1 Tax=Geoglobus acetivorans TaxID=565033 RepID=A0A0A7GD65_GEOAI|nr:hypothetical protein GACE_0969 [Geoglobus acetivorans]MBE8539113.1 hypothetical protein [Geoglobus acetivorans]
MKEFLRLWGIMFVALSAVNFFILSIAYGGMPEPSTHLRVIGITFLSSIVLAGLVGAVMRFSRAFGKSESFDRREMA